MLWAIICQVRNSDDIVWVPVGKPVFIGHRTPEEIEEARAAQAGYILRGIRTEGDYEFERTMRHINDDLDSSVSTVFLMPPRGIAEISSSFVKGLVGPQGWEAVAVDGYHRAVHLVDPADGVCRSRATDGGGDKRRL